MRKVMFISLVILWGTINAQKQVPLDTIIEVGSNKGKFIFFNQFDSIQVYCQKGDTRKQDGPYTVIQKDTVSNKWLGSPMYFKNIILFETYTDDNKRKKLVYYSLKSKSFHDFGFQYEHSRNGKYQMDLSYSKLYTKASNENGIKLFLIDPISKEKKLFADFSKYNQFRHEGYYDGKTNFAGIQDVYFFNKKKAYVKLGYNEHGAGYGNFKYFIAQNGNKQEITSKLLPDEIKDTWKPIKNSIINFVSTDQNFIRESFENKDLHIARVLNKNFDVIGNALFMGSITKYGNKIYKRSRGGVMYGINLQHDIIRFYFLKSLTNKDKSVIIPYKFIPELDLAMYKAHQNEKLTKDDIKGLDLYALGILRNSIFAKYNYAFNSEFYQAYFNLFAFYNHSEKKGKRTKNINDKLTDTDKANVALILNAEKKLGN